MIPPRSPAWLVIALIVALLALMTFEYRSLAGLRDASVVEQRVALARFAELIRIGIDTELRAICDRALERNAQSIGRRGDPGAESSLAGLLRDEPLQSLFSVSWPQGGATWSVRHAAPHDDEASNEPSLAMRAAAAPWLLRAGEKVGPHEPVAFDEDPSFPMLVLPLVDADQRLTRILGLVLNPVRFARERLPALIEAQRAPTLRVLGRGDPALLIVDGTGAPVFAQFADEGRGEALVARRATFLPSWRVEVRNRGGSIPEEVSRAFLRNVAIAGMLSILLAVFLLLVVRQSAQAIRLARMKSEFVANVSHELKTPLAALRLLGDHLQDGRIHAAGDVRRYGARIASETCRLTGRVDRLLDYARLESGRIPLSPAAIHLDDLVEQTVDRFRARLPDDRAPITVQRGEVGVEAIVDRDAIEQALVELLDNAVKYSPNDMPVELSVERARDGALVHVHDSGPGIPAEDRALLFERFQRGRPSLVHDVKGFGLGLAIARELVAAHGGTITVASVPGRGSTFSIFLPRSHPSSAGSKSTQEKPR